MKRNILFIAIAAAGLSACDMLDKTPLDKLSPESYFKTETDLQMFSNSFYNNLLDKSPFDNQSDVQIHETLSNELIGGTKRIIPASGGGWSWSDLRKMNTLLAYAPQYCEDKNAVTKYSAVTRFFRAYFYFEKVKRFGDVPWYDVELGSDDPALMNPRDSRELVMSKMLEDIDFAIKNLSEAKIDGSGSGPFRVNKWAALALKSRFCLFEGTFRKYHNINLEGKDYKFYLEQAAEAAKEIIEKGPYKLYDTGKPEKDYLNLFTAEDANSDEYILALKFDYSLAIQHNGTGYSLLETQGQPGFTRKLINMYLMKDGRRFTDISGWQTMEFKDEVKGRDPRLAQSIRTLGYHRIGKTEILPPSFDASVTGYQPIKFVQDPTAAGGQVDRNDRSTNDLPVFRYAEVLLNYAEALAELGTLTQDDLDKSINKIRDRAGMIDLDMSEANANPDWYLMSAEYGFPNVKGANAGVILEIRRERDVELIQEGFRYYDIIRWKAGKSVDQQMYGMYFPGPGEYDLTGDGKPDLCLYTGAKPDSKAAAVYEIGTRIILSDGDKGYVSPTGNTRQGFNEDRDYFYPIPINERSLNPNLKQNPGWNDGLDF